MLWGECMFEIILIVIALFLSAIGVGELLHRLWMHVLRPKNLKCFLVVPLCDDATEQITAVLEEMRWYGKNYADILIGIDAGLPENERKRCKEIETLTTNFVFCDADKIKEVIKRGE